jgi:2-C-methyl-D-erythritol 4-phosphate cytidylyltransferase
MSAHPSSNTVSVILLAGGQGLRMGAATPKQFLVLEGKPMARFSFDIFHSMPEVDEVVVVCSPDYRQLFEGYSWPKPVKFALPGARRQDSVFSGMQEVSPSCGLVCIHDGARPFIDTSLVERVLQAARQYGAAAAGMPVKFTVKECCSQGFVRSTPDRSGIWEVQTPQAVRLDWLVEGFRHSHGQGITVTDDVSLVELLGKEVRMVEGAHHNIKVTVPIDLTIAQNILATIKQSQGNAS